MSLTDKVASMICAEIKDSDGLVYQSAVDTRADIIINFVLDDFIEEVKSALGCTDGDDIRAHLEPLIKQIKGER